MVGSDESLFDRKGEASTANNVCRMRLRGTAGARLSPCSVGMTLPPHSMLPLELSSRHYLFTTLRGSCAVQLWRGCLILFHERPVEHEVVLVALPEKEVLQEPAEVRIVW